MTTGFVLVHGAELGAWIWEPVVARLDHPAVAVDLPGRSATRDGRARLTLDDAVAAVVAAVDALAAERVLLVAHSFAGVLAPAVATARPDVVTDVIWLGATVPVAGRSFVDLQPVPARWVLKVLYRLRPAGMLSPEADTVTSLGHDLHPDALADLLARRVVEPPPFLTTPAPTATVPAGVRNHYVTMRDDRAVPAATTAAMADRLGDAARLELGGGHLPMLARPAELAGLLDTLARPS